MSYKTLLVHLDEHPRSDLRLAFALTLAHRFDAHLVALYLDAPWLAGVQALSHAAGLALPAETMRLREQAREQASAAAHREGIAFEWRAPENGSPAGVAALHARHADLLVLGQPDLRDGTAQIARAFIEDLLMTAGRPAIVLPHAGPAPAIGDNVLIAWDGGRECARAVSDALPLLARARFVTVETVRHEQGATSDFHAPGGIDIADYLERHGIDAAFGSTPHGIGKRTGTTLLNLASGLHSDLIVAGAYGHSRFRERVLGGTTRTLLETMMVPVLMSH